MTLPRDKTTRNWRQTSRVFQERAAEYDSWFDHSGLFTTELAALQQVTAELPLPRVEIGAGPGRFGQALNVCLGIDPAPAALQRGMKRGIMGVAAVGEQLPLRTERVGTVFILFTLCFLVDARQVIGECHRILQSDGNLVIGLIPADSAWGRQLEKKKNEQHPYYKYAHFYTIQQTLLLLEQTGFTLSASCSTLMQPPDRVTQVENAQPGCSEQAGFCVLVAGKKEKS
jgi:ubiquinone/menaquinone biosynthesis C-methylase UbiE